MRSIRGAADISFIAPYADGAHSPAEELELSSLPVAIKRAAILVCRLTRRRPG
jgi:glutamate carboxypeptidase